MILRSVILFSLLAAAPQSAKADSGLAGTWIVDLSPESDGSYVKDMMLTLNADGSVTGSFYDSSIEDGRWKTARGRTCASFRTSDGSAPYQSAVCLDGETAVGQTWSEGRKFLFNWNAMRKSSGE